MRQILATKATIGYWGSIIMAMVVETLWISVLWIGLAFFYLWWDMKINVAITSSNERKEEHKEESEPTVGN